MSVFDRFFGKRGDVSAARKAELRGDLSRAQTLWAEADRPGEAARVMLLRGDAETDVRTRLAFYTQAAAMAPEVNDAAGQDAKARDERGHDVKRLARKKRAELVVALSGGGALSAVARHDLLDAARELEAIGELESAAAAFALAGDDEGEARALAASGDLDRLEEVLGAAQSKDRGVRRRREAHAEIDLLIACGRRREALALAETLAAEDPNDAIARERATSLRARRALGPTLAIDLHGARLDLLVGDAVVIGRTEGSLLIPSQAVSRRHLQIARINGAAVVTDLGSRNGTFLRGARVAGALPVGDGLDLKLGNEVRVRVAPYVATAAAREAIEGALVIEAAGGQYVAPLGALRIGPWRIEMNAERGTSAGAAWLEIVSSDEAPAFVNGASLVGRATLLVGDVLALRRGGEPIVRIVRRGDAA